MMMMFFSESIDFLRCASVLYDCLKNLDKKINEIHLHLLIFLSITENKKIKGVNIFNHTFLYTAYADDTTFFLKDKESLIEVMKVFHIFSSFSGLKPNKSKCEVAGIGALKGAKWHPVV